MAKEVEALGRKMYAPLACNRVWCRLQLYIGVCVCVCVCVLGPEEACGARLPVAAAALPAASAGLATLTGLVVAKDLVRVQAKGSASGRF